MVALIDAPVCHINGNLGKHDRFAYSPIVGPEMKVSLRQWKDSDFAPFALLNADPQVMRHFPGLLTRGQSDSLAQRQRELIERQGWGLWAVDVGGAFAGFTGLAMPAFEAAFTPCVEIGWRLAREYWGRGIAYDAAQQALHHAFTTLHLSEVVSFTAGVNDRSRRIMERLGMVRDPKEDFLHPKLPQGHELSPHVLYRKQAPMIFREMEPRDIRRCLEVRTSVRENCYSLEALEREGITEASVTEMLATTHKGWVCEMGGNIVGFSMGDRSTGEFFVLAVLPEYESRGMGRKLMELAVAWLRASGCMEIWLWTSPDTSTRAYALYCKAHWEDCGVQDGRRIMKRK